VHDTGSVGPTYGGQLADAVKQSIDQRALTVPGRGVYDHSGRLIDDQETLVLEQHINRDILSDRGGGLGRRNLDDDHIVDFRYVAFLGDSLVDANAAVLDQSGDVRA